nr:serine/threonine-protein kinase [Bifidobacterium platyrrhinorum]
MSDLTALNLEPGEVVGGYTLISRLGSGAMGSVWRVRDDGGQVYAMKILRDSLAEDGADAGAPGAPGSPARRPVQDPNLKENVTPRERLRREALALRKVNHPGVCGIVDMELDDALAFIVTELIEGRNLKDDVAANGRYVGDDLERLTRKLIEAVKAVHAAGIVHRDIKPTNVMVSASGPVLVDFGIAMGEGESHVTRTGLVMGTPGFIAPEIIDGADSDEATDWWSVASVLAFAAMGEPVFGTKPMMAVLEREASGNANLAGLPAHTLTAFRSALNPDPSRRCTPDQLLHAIALDALNPLGWDGDAMDAGMGATPGATEVMRPFDAIADDAATTPITDMPTSLMAGPHTVPTTDAADTNADTNGNANDADADASNIDHVASARDAWRYGDGDGSTDATQALTPDQCTVALPSDRLGPGDATAVLTGTATDRSPLQRLADATNRTAASLPPAYVPSSPRDGDAGAPDTTNANDDAGKTAVMPSGGVVPEFLRDAQPTAIQPPLPPQPAYPAAAPPNAVQPYAAPMANRPPYPPNQPAYPNRPPYPNQGNPAAMRRERYLQRGTLPLSLTAIAPAIAALVHPLAGLAVAAVLLWLLYAIGYGVESQLEREAKRGGVRKGSDVALTIVQLPWHLVRALLAALGRTVQFALIDIAGMTAVTIAMPLPWAMTPTPGGYWPYELPWPTDGPFSNTGVALAGMAAIAWLLTALWPSSGALRLGAGALRGTGIDAAA